MATAPVSIAPVLTPHTLGVLADTLERDEFPEKASSLRRLKPFVEIVVEKFFLPLSTQARKGTLVGRFNKLSRDFEPFRLYLNLQLFNTLNSPEFFGIYEQTLRGVLDPLMKTAQEMEMAPALISAAFHDYMRIVRALAQSSGATTSPSNDFTVEQFTHFVDWFHAATRFDYGLTAICLVLERTIPEPAPTDKGALLSVFKKALLELAETTSKIAVHVHMQHVLQDLETSRIKITVARNGVRAASLPSRNKARKKVTFGLSPRQAERDWLVRNKDLSDRYGGQWIVLEKDELVANDEDYRKAREAASQRGIKRPFIIFVPLKGSEGFMGL